MSNAEFSYPKNSLAEMVVHIKTTTADMQNIMEFDYPRRRLSKERVKMVAQLLGQMLNIPASTIAGNAIPVLEVFSSRAGKKIVDVLKKYNLPKAPKHPDVSENSSENLKIHLELDDDFGVGRNEGQWLVIFPKYLFSNECIDQTFASIQAAAYKIGIARRDSFSERVQEGERSGRSWAKGIDSTN